MKKLIWILPLVFLVLIILFVIGCGIQMLPVNTTVATTLPETSVTTTAPTTPATTATTATTVATTAATTLATTAITETAPPTTTPTETAPPVTNNAREPWWFIKPSPLNQDIPATISIRMTNLISNYNILWQAPPTDRKTIYLTMDMGYEYNNNTTKILDTAAEKGVPITFFVIGSYLEKNPDLIMRMVNEGHLVANHTYAHPNLIDLLNESGEAGLMADTHKLEVEYKELTGQEMPKLFRPSSGIFSEQVLDCMTRNGYQTVFWSFAYRDWLTAEQPTPDDARASILGQLHDGSILLLHAVSNTNAELLPELIDAIRERGYEFGRIDQIKK